MENLILLTKRRVIWVKAVANNRLFLTCDGEHSIKDAGNFIKSAGGVKKVIEKCIRTPLSFEEMKRMFRREIFDQNKKRYEAYRKFLDDHRDEYKAQYEKVAATEPHADASQENVTVILRYLNSLDPDQWPELPALSLSYKVSVYPVTNTRNTTTMELEDGRKYAFGCTSKKLKDFIHLK